MGKALADDAFMADINQSPDCNRVAQMLSPIVVNWLDSASARLVKPSVITATITPVAPGAGTPTGSVSFFDGATLLGTGTLSVGVATFTTSTLSVASHAVTAVYAGDTNFAGSTSPVDTHPVNQALEDFESGPGGEESGTRLAERVLAEARLAREKLESTGMTPISRSLPAFSSAVR